MSPISSRKTVPPSATSSLPRFWVAAPVKAPFSWPNNSDSRSSSERATQFTGMNSRPRRALQLWIDRARRSLPVPLSPRRMTVESL